jgi:hypothetical protein
VHSCVKFLISKPITCSFHSNHMFAAALEGPALGPLLAVNDASDAEAPAAEVPTMLVSVPPFPPPSAPPSPSVTPSPLIPGGCPGLSIALRFDNYTTESFGSEQVDAFCEAIKSATSWTTTDCAATVIDYPSPLPAVVVSAYVVLEPNGTTDDLSTELITAAYYRDLLVNSLNQTTLLPVIFSNLSSADLVDECFAYTSYNLGYICSAVSKECAAKRGCFADSRGNEYLKNLFADSFTCVAPSPPLYSSREANILVEILDILNAPVPESEPFSPPTPVPSLDSPPPSPISSPPPPVTPSVCTYIGTYRLQAVACPGKYLAVFPGCRDRAVALRSSMQAPASRILWKLNTTTVDEIGVPAPITSLRSCPGSSLHLTSPSGNRQPTLGGNSWRFQVVPSSSSCSTVNLIANSRLSGAPFLGVSSTCDSFVWSSSANGTSTQFKAIRV